jgi:hypothetical protein
MKAGGFWIILAIIVYLTLTGWLCDSMGYGVTQMIHTPNWQVPYMSYSLGAFSYILDMLIFLVNIVLWFFQCLGSYMSLFYWTIKGDIPYFATALCVTPVMLGLGWMVIELVRG